MIRHINGRQVEGEYAADRIEGQGKVAYEDGSSYRGTFKDGLRHGQGEG